MDIKLCKHDECTGCMACLGVCAKNAISVMKDKEGFSYPMINYDKCIGCQHCVKTCPVLNPVEKNHKGTVYAAWTLNDDIRLRSSSGGLFSELALVILKNGGAVVGASLNDEGYVFHQFVENESELELLRGSKYVQSNIVLDLYAKVKQCLKEKKKVLFTGTPCQVAGARKLFRDNENLYTMDLVCHGVPSPEFFAKIFRDIKHKFPNLVSYNFRKLDSWGVCSSVNININNTIFNLRLTGKYTLYQDAFMKGYLHRLNCYCCPYATIDRVGDLTVADFWGIGKYKPIIDDYKKGCSMLSVNSFKGQVLFNVIKDRIYFEERDIHETIDGGNMQLIMPSRRPDERNSFYKDAYSLSYNRLIRKYNLEIVHDMNSFYGIFRRIFNCLKKSLFK